MTNEQIIARAEGRKGAMAAYIAEFLRKKMQEGRSTDDLFSGDMIASAMTSFESSDQTGEEFKVIVLDERDEASLHKCIGVHDNLVSSLKSQLPARFAHEVDRDPLVALDVLMTETESMSRQIQTDAVYIQMHDELVSCLKELVDGLEQAGYAKLCFKDGKAVNQNGVVIEAARELLKQAQHAKAQNPRPIEARVRSAQTKIMGQLERLADSYSMMLQHGYRAPTQLEMDASTEVLNESVALLADLHGGFLSEPHVMVEYDTNFHGGEGDYSSVGQYAYIPVSRIAAANGDVGAAFAKQTGLPAVHVIRYASDAVYTKTGEPFLEGVHSLDNDTSSNTPH